MAPFNTLISTMLKPANLAGYVLFLILVFNYFDQPIAYYFHDVVSTQFTNVLQIITKIGLGLPYFVGLPLCALFFRYISFNKKYQERALFLWLCVLLPSISCIPLKMILGRARPVLLFKEHLYGFYGFHTSVTYWSFPSGHTSTVIGLILGLCIVFPRYFYAFIFSGLMVVSSRVLLTYHYFSDVLGTFLLTLLEIGLLFFWLRSKKLLVNAYQ